MNSWQIFEAIGQLKDRDSSVRERLFEYLNKGTESSNYSQILDALVNISEVVLKCSGVLIGQI